MRLYYANLKPGKEKIYLYKQCTYQSIWNAFCAIEQLQARRCLDCDEVR